MKYKALFLDLDGTTIESESLGNFNSLPTPRVARAISDIKDKLYVCVATGRPLYAAKYIFDHLKLSGLCILNNGVQIYDPIHHKIIHEVTLDKTLLPIIISLCKKYTVEINLYDGVKDFPYKEGKLPETIFSIYIPNTTEKIVDNLMRDLSTYSTLATHKMTHAKDFFLEITNSNASKLHGINEVAKRLGIKTHEIIGVGDSHNDFPLLMASGLKFAMGNAVSELKAIADFIAPSVEDDGVAIVIEKFILPLFEP